MWAGGAGTAGLGGPEAGVGMVVQADAVFGHRVVTVPRGNLDVFGLEPQSNAPCAFDGLEDGRLAPGVHILSPGESLSGNLRFSLTK